MPDQIGNITVPALVPSGVFPIPVEFGFLTTLSPPIAIHTFGAANQKREQRFSLGPGYRQFQIDRELDETERSALRDFWEIQSGPTTPFTFNCPLPNGTTTPIICVFMSEPLVWEYQPGMTSKVQVKLTEVGPLTGPGQGPFTIISTLTRFPDSTLNTALTGQNQTLIPLVHIRPRLAGYPDNIFLSDRRVTIGGRLYLPRLLKWEGIGQHAVGLPNVSAESDDVTLVFGNADRVMRQLADNVQLDLARVEFLVFHMDSGILLQLWAGEVVPGGWASNTGPEFTLKCSDFLASPFMVAPPRVVDRMCGKFYNDHNTSPGGCPWAEETTGLDTSHYPSASALVCDHGYDTANGCLAHGLKHRYGGIVATPQSVKVKDNSTGIFGIGRSTFTSVSLISDSAYGLPLPIVVTDIDIPVACLMIAGRDEGDFYEGMGVVCQGPVTFSNNQNGIGQSIDGIYNHGYPGNLGLRVITGFDPAPDLNFMSLDQNGDQTASNPDAPPWRLVFSGGSTYLDNFAAGVAAIIVRVPNPKGLQLTTLQSHSMQAWLKQGWKGWVWTDPSTALADQPLTNPVWFAANLYMLCMSVLNSTIGGEREALLDLPSLVAAAAVCNLTVTRIVESSEGPETQFKAIGVLKDQRALRDWLNDILTNCLGYYTFSFGKLRIGIRDNASAVAAYTDGNMLWRSLTLQPLGPQFTKIVCNFADREYNWVNNSATFQDDDYAQELGGSTRPIHRVSNFNLAFTADISPATRIAITRGREEIGGVTAAERIVARRVQWSTTVLGFDTEPGAVISITDIEIPNGFGHFRVESWRLMPDWSIQLTGRSVTPSMYDLVAGPKPADIRPSPIPPELFAEPLGPEWHPNAVTPASTDPIYPPTDSTFSLAELFIPIKDGTEVQPEIFVVGRTPINSYSAGVSPPQILKMDTAPIGGNLAGGHAYFAVVWLRFADRTVSPPSNVISLFIPSGTNTNVLSPDSIRWPSLTGTPRLVGYSIGLGIDDARQMCWQTDTDTSTLPTSLTIPGPLKISTYNVPNPAPSKVRAKVKYIRHSGTNGARITSVGPAGSQTITCHDLIIDPILAAALGWTTDWTGRRLSIILSAATGISPLWDFAVTAWDGATGTFTLSPDPRVLGVQAGDVAVIRLKSTISSPLTIGDSGFTNSQIPVGLQASSEKGELIYLKKAAVGRWQIRKVVDNDSTTYTIDRPWDTGFEPAPTDFWFVASPDWRFAADTTPFTNPYADAELSVTVPVPNFQLQQVLVGAFIEDREGKETPEQFCHLQEIYIAGTPSLAGVGPEWAPHNIHASSTDALFPGEWTFHVIEQAYSFTSGRTIPILSMFGARPVNAPLANCPAPVVASAIVLSGGHVDGGASGYLLTVQVCAMDANRNLSPPSAPIHIPIPAGGGHKVELQGVTWPNIDGFTQYVIFASPVLRFPDDTNPDLICAQRTGALTGNHLGYTPSNVDLDSGLAGGDDLERSTWAVPNPATKAVRFEGYPLLHGGVLGASIDQVIDSTHFLSHATIDTALTDNWASRAIAVIGSATFGQDIPFLFLTCSGFDPATGIFTVNDTSALAPDMVFVVCTKGVSNSGTPTQITDAGLSNASNFNINTGLSTPHSGLATDQDKGAFVRVLAGTSRGMEAEIIGNSGTTYTLATPLPIDATSVWIVRSPAKLFSLDSDSLTNPDYQALVGMAWQEVSNGAEAILIYGLTLDNTNTPASTVDAPVRMVYARGQSGIFTETGHIDCGLDTDSITQGPSSNGINAPGKYGVIQESGQPFLASFTCVGVPTTADAIADFLISSDGGATWTSIFPPGPGGNPNKYKLRFPQSSSVARVDSKMFKNIIFNKKTDIVRVDMLQSGGATGLKMTVKYGLPGSAS